MPRAIKSHYGYTSCFVQDTTRNRVGAEAGSMGQPLGPVPPPQELFPDMPEVSPEFLVLTLGCEDCL